MVPRRGFARQCDAQFVVGETYRMEVVEERSAATHRHFFAAVNEAWQNLPENLAEAYPSPEHLRKRALIKAGFADSHQIVASSKAEALRIAAFIRPLDEYAVVTVSGSVVTRFTAQSQSVKAMGKERFQASKDAVLGLVAALIGVTPDDLVKQGEAA
jgi:hypothetical protein